MSNLKGGNAKQLENPRVKTQLPLVWVGQVQQVDFAIQEGYEEGCEQGLKYVAGEFEKEN